MGTGDSQLLDRLAVQDVILRYAAGIDDKDFQMYEDCFAHDVEVYPSAGKCISGRSNWITYVKERLGNYSATQHMLGPQLAEITGDKAVCRTDVQATHFMKDEEDMTMTLWATYKSEMIRQNGGWKIKTHNLIRRGSRIQKG